MSESSASQVYASETDTLLTQILRAVANEEGCRITELPPLYDAIEADILMRVIEGPGVSEVTFQYLTYSVTIDGERRVQITRARR